MRPFSINDQRQSIISASMHANEYIIEIYSNLIIPPMLWVKMHICKANKGSTNITFLAVVFHR